MTQTDQPVMFNPFEPGFTDNPYPHLKTLREQVPVHEHPMGFWLLLRHADVTELLRAKLSVEEHNVTVGQIRELREAAYGDGAPRSDGLSMLDRDPPDHDRLRKLVTKAFTMRTIEKLEPRVVELVDQALDRMADAGRFNLVQELAFPLPFRVITEMMGMPETDEVRLRELTGTLVRSLEPVNDPELLQQIADADRQITELTIDAINWKRQHPADDLLTALIAAEDDGDKLSEQELVSQVVLLYVAGHETTVNLIGNGTLALLNHPDQRALLASRPDLDGNAVEELLRFDSPVQMSRRVTLEPYEVDGNVIAPGTAVLLSIASANRDPAVFGLDADKVLIERANARHHTSFGGGVHHCLGAALARLEGRTALGRLVRRFPDLRLDGDVEWNGRINLRGPEVLPVAVR
ncbi:cytochrome P450 [Fodinicola feengrottensis]|uniref:Cytochrome P450 n=1 Tax=Fodinicola feengrottensis TaxID=435914 RepID=A0ABN2GV99_9ACTN